jgi:hypothetical protein
MVIVDRRTVFSGFSAQRLFRPTLPVFDPTASAGGSPAVAMTKRAIRPLLEASGPSTARAAFASAAPAVSRSTPPACRKIKRPVSGSPGTSSGIHISSEKKV